MQLVAQNVTHRFGPLAVLEDINLTFDEGKITAIIGPSGCGKSTLLSILGGMLEPTGGRVGTVGEVSPSSLNPFTYVFQDFALLPWRTVADNIRLVLDPHPLSETEKSERLADVLRRTGLSDFSEYLPKQLSGGMRQRVGIARALIVSPAILFMDEPLSALDAQTREILMDDFIDLWVRERLTGVYVTHNLNEAMRLADSVVVLSRRPGRVREIVNIGIPQSDRTSLEAQPELARIQNDLWQLIRTEAQVADREIVNE